MSASRAVALNNGGQWFEAQSRLSVSQIEHRFQRETVASILYDKVGAILPAATKRGVLIQLQMTADKLVMPDFSDEPVWTQEPVTEPEWHVTLALKELGVTLSKPTDEPYLIRRARTRT